MSESCEECSTVGSCPFAFTEESEKAQGYGCLPEPWDIRNMRVIHGKTWACHSNPDKPCLGAIKFLQERGEPYKVIDTNLVTLNTDWEKFIKDGDSHLQMEMSI